MTQHLTEPDTTGLVPASVWPVAQTSDRDQRRGRYLPTSLRHPTRMLPALAARAIDTWTQPGDLVLDPLAGIGTTLLEAVYAGRDAIGADINPTWVAATRRNLAHAHSQAATGTGLMLHTDARHPPQHLTDFAGRAALMLFSPPHRWQIPGLLKTRQTAGPDIHHSLAVMLTAVLNAWLPLLAPGGTIMVAAHPWRRAGHLIDVPGAVAIAAERVGLVAVERLVALRVALRGQGLVVHGSLAQLRAARTARAAGRPDHVLAHDDVWVLRHPTEPAANDQVLSPPAPSSACGTISLPTTTTAAA